MSAIDDRGIDAVRLDRLEGDLGTELRTAADLEEVYRSRIARYWGSERPACRMNQTGVRSTGSRRAARTRSGDAILLSSNERSGQAIGSAPEDRAPEIPDDRFLDLAGADAVPAARSRRAARRPVLAYDRGPCGRAPSGSSASSSRTPARRPGRRSAAKPRSRSPTTGSTRLGNAIVWDGARRARRPLSAARREASLLAQGGGAGCRRAATVWRSTSSTTGGSGSPRSATRASSSRSTSCRGSPAARSPSPSATARPSLPAVRGRRSRVRRSRWPRRRRGDRAFLAPAACPPPTGAGGSSTPTRRATRRPAARSPSREAAPARGSRRARALAARLRPVAQLAAAAALPVAGAERCCGAPWRTPIAGPADARPGRSSRAVAVRRRIRVSIDVELCDQPVVDPPEDEARRASASRRDGDGT